MVIKGSARGEPSRLARHLVSTENESATVTELRGVASDNLTDALSELTALRLTSSEVSGWRRWTSWKLSSVFMGTQES